eukprot:TRINITY_DN39915_c0_g1_i1.p1 TRINITY_DN39915_c0_g1~~TRINITY_DN39915_c0_g1_i1.p1  ORF type:complete len:267 (+),score=66.66 TRINITY_DN39915_c0_g1_i1:99-899(+)
MPVLIEQMTNEEEANAQQFTFHHLPEAKFEAFCNPSLAPLFEKWGMAMDMCTCAFRVDQPVHPDSMQAMLECFFRDRGVTGVLQHLTGIRIFNPDKVKVRYQQMGTKVVSMSFFNKLQECGAIGPSGHIRGRLEEDFEGVPIVNLIREAMLMEESELYDTFTEQERKEFLYCIFKHIVFGGASNQYEDHVEEYFKATKEVYKDLLTVRRGDTGDVEVMSTVAKVVSLGYECGQLFPKESLLNFCYVIHDPVMRHVKVWYFAWKPLW